MFCVIRSKAAGGMKPEMPYPVREIRRQVVNGNISRSYFGIEPDGRASVDP